MRHADSSRSIWPSAFWWLTTAIAIVIGSAISVGHALAMELSASTQEQQPTAPEPELPLDAFGYLGGLSEARFYEPHTPANDPRAEIRVAASLYGVDVAMMMSIAKVESDFDPRTRTGSYKGLFQLSDHEFAKYGDGSIWDARDNARAAAHMFLIQAEQFKVALGHYPEYAERYMVHQQGIQGAIEHYTHPDRTAWQSMCATDEGVLKGEQWCRRTIWGNLLPQWKDAFGNVDKISSRDFVSLWTDRIDHLANRFSLDADAGSATVNPKARYHRRLALQHTKQHPPALHGRRIRVALIGMHRQ